MSYAAAGRPTPPRQQARPSVWRFGSPHHCSPRVRHADFRTKSHTRIIDLLVLSIPKFIDETLVFEHGAAGVAQIGFLSSQNKK